MNYQIVALMLSSEKLWTSTTKEKLEGKFRDYLATSLANKIHKLELRRAKIEIREQLRTSIHERIQQRKQKLAKQPLIEIPSCNWLED